MHTCDECGKAGWSPTVYPYDTRVRTALAVEETFSDQNGERHRHDPNVTMTRYRCAHGHAWIESCISACPVDGCAFNSQVLAWRGHWLAARRCPFL